MTSEPQTRHPHLTVEEFRTLPEEAGYRLEGIAPLENLVSEGFP